MTGEGNRAQELRENLAGLLEETEKMETAKVVQLLSRQLDTINKTQGIILTVIPALAVLLEEELRNENTRKIFESVLQLEGLLTEQITAADLLSGVLIGRLPT